jgi:hypothetical protein
MSRKKRPMLSDRPAKKRAVGSNVFAERLNPMVSIDGGELALIPQEIVTIRASALGQPGRVGIGSSRRHHRCARSAFHRVLTPPPATVP